VSQQSKSLVDDQYKFNSMPVPRDRKERRIS